MQLQRLDKYEPGVRLIALFPVGVYKSTGQDASARATKMSAGEVVTVHGDGDAWGGLLVQWRNAHYLVYARGDFAVAPEPYQIAWLLVDGNIQRGRADRLQARYDEVVEEILHLKKEAAANRQIFQGEQFLLKKALDYLEKLNGVLKDADEDFNFSGDHDPDGAPDA